MIPKTLEKTELYNSLLFTCNKIAETNVGKFNIQLHVEIFEDKYGNVTKDYWCYVTLGENSDIEQFHETNETDAFAKFGKCVNALSSMY